MRSKGSALLVLASVWLLLLNSIPAQQAVLGAAAPAGTSSAGSLASGEAHLIGQVNVANLPEPSGNAQDQHQQQSVHEVSQQDFNQQKQDANSQGFVPQGEDAKVVSTSTAGALATSTYLVFEGAPGDPPNPCGCSPPDPNLGVGPSHVFEMVNLLGIIYTKSGAVAKSIALSDFFLLPTSSMSDPQIIFDQGSGRWFASIIDIPNGRVQFAVSASSDPTGTWNVYFVSTPDVSTLPDQPFIGTSDDKFVISANDFAGGDTFIGAQYWILNKAELVGGAATVHFATNTPDPSFASVHPAQHLGSSSGKFYMVTVFPIGTSGTATLVIVSGVPGLSSVTISTNSFAINPISVPPDAAQPLTSTLLVTNDDRVLSAVWESNTLWFTATDACKPNGDTTTRSCLRLIQVTTSGTAPPSKGFDFDYASSGQYLFYPAVSLYQGQLVVVYGTSSPTVYPSLLVTGRTPGDLANTLQTPATVRTGTTPDTSTRYGDYFGAATDPTPSSASTFWVAGEYRISSGFQSWNTAIAQVGSFSGAPPPAPYSATFSESGIATGTNWGVTVGGTRYTSTTASVTVPGLTGTVPYTYDSTVSGTGTGTQYVCNTGCSGSVSPSVTAVSSAYKTQYQLTMQVSTSGSGTTSPTIGVHWYDSGLSVTVSATANAGYAFSSWSGTGSGSYSGVANPASVTMNSPIAETANFVTATFDFSISVNPTSDSAVQGSAKTATVTVTLVRGSTQSVTLSASVSPSATGLTVGFNPTNGSPMFSSAMTVTTSTGTLTGIYTITVTGTGGGLTRSATYKLTVTSTPPPDFGISASPSSITIDPGTTGTSTITVNSLYGFSGTVGLTASSLPSGVTAGFSFNSVTVLPGGFATSTITLTVAPNATPGIYILTVIGTAAGSSGLPPHSISITLTITSNQQGNN